MGEQGVEVVLVVGLGLLARLTRENAAVNLIAPTMPQSAPSGATARQLICRMVILMQASVAVTQIVLVGHQFAVNMGIVS